MNIKRNLLIAGSLIAALTITGCTATSPVSPTPAHTSSSTTSPKPASPTPNASDAADAMNSAKNYTCDNSGTLVIGDQTISCTPNSNVKVLLDDHGKVVSSQVEVKLDEGDQSTIDQLGK